MFRNLRISIFVYYLLTVITFLGVLYYFLVVANIQNIFLLAVFLLCFIILSGIFISKLAVDPLVSYVHNLQELSKETLHELNLPISTIKTNTQMLKKQLQDLKALKRIQRVESACEMLQQRYNELDYMIKMQTKEDVKEFFNVAELLQDRVAFLQSIYPHIIFRLDLEALEINSDKIGLSKVIDNIVDNGVKYSGNSKNIDIQLIDKKLTIKDYGIGMDELELIRIFDTYYQANKEMQGFGIGLSMVKRYCEKNKIDLSFDSKLKEGTTVTLDFKKV